MSGLQCAPYLLLTKVSNNSCYSLSTLIICQVLFKKLYVKSFDSQLYEVTAIAIPIL